MLPSISSKKSWNFERLDVANSIYEGKLYLWRRRCTHEGEDVLMKGRWIYEGEDAFMQGEKTLEFLKKLKVRCFSKTKEIPRISHLKSIMWIVINYHQIKLCHEVNKIPTHFTKVYNVFVKGKMYLWRRRCVFEGKMNLWRGRCIYEGEDVFMKGKMYLWREDVFMKGKMYSWSGRCIYEGRMYLWREKKILEFLQKLKLRCFSKTKEIPGISHLKSGQIRGIFERKIRT